MSSTANTAKRRRRQACFLVKGKLKTKAGLKAQVKSKGKG